MKFLQIAVPNRKWICLKLNVELLKQITRRLENKNSFNLSLDSPWRYSDVPRSSSMVLGSLTSELVRERRELERTEPSVSFVDCSQRNGDFPPSACMYWKAENV